MFEETHPIVDSAATIAADRARRRFALAGTLSLVPSALFTWGSIAAAATHESAFWRSFDAMTGGPSGIVLLIVAAVFCPLLSMWCGLAYRASRGGLFVTALLLLTPPIFGLLAIFAST